jgi:putative membrane protein
MKEEAWRQQGEEPDYRFTLANERTFLAWIRTALAILAAGILLDQFSTRLQPPTLVVTVAVLLSALAAVLGVQAYNHWRANEIAMRHKGRLPTTALLPIVAGGITVAAALLLTLLMLPRT